MVNGECISNLSTDALLLFDRSPLTKIPALAGIFFCAPQKRSGSAQLSSPLSALLVMARDFSLLVKQKACGCG
jgi:hypothetical protein